MKPCVLFAGLPDFFVCNTVSVGDAYCLACFCSILSQRFVFFFAILLYGYVLHVYRKIENTSIRSILVFILITVRQIIFKLKYEFRPPVPITAQTAACKSLSRGLQITFKWPDNKCQNWFHDCLREQNILFSIISCYCEVL